MNFFKKLGFWPFRREQTLNTETQDQSDSEVIRCGDKGMTPDQIRSVMLSSVSCLIPHSVNRMQNTAYHTHTHTHTHASTHTHTHKAKQNKAKCFAAA